MEFYNITVDTQNANAVTKGDLLFGRYAAFSVKKPVPLTGKNLSVETPEGWPDTIYINDTPEAGNYSAHVEVSRVSSTTVTAVAADPDAVIKVNGQPLESAGMMLDLSRGKNVLTVEATSGSEKLTYTLTAQNNWPSSGSGSSATCPIETSDRIEHGTVTVKPSRAEKGDTVTITAKPEEGYQVGKVTVTDKNGSTIKVTDKGSGKYTFIMPNSAVSVDVTFVPKGQWTNPFVDVPEDTWYY